MLGLDLDLEADLGIDSIKRVEILGSLTEAESSSAINPEMEKLTGIKTLRGIIDCLAGLRTDPAKDGAGDQDSTGPNGSMEQLVFARLPVSAAGHERAGIQRMLVAPACSWRRLMRFCPRTFHRSFPRAPC
jgi:hypothetical protein